MKTRKTLLAATTALGKRMPSVLAGAVGAIRKTPDGYTCPDPAELTVRSQVLAAASALTTPLGAAAMIATGAASL